MPGGRQTRRNTMRRIRQFVALAGLSALDIIRQPITLMLSMGCALLIGVIPLVLLHSLGEDGKLARDSGLALQLLFGLFLAGYASTSTLADEIRGGTAAVILSKPVPRPMLLLGKFGGLTLVMLVYAAATSIAILLCERVAEISTFSGDASIGMVDWRTGRWLVMAPLLALAVAGVYNFLTHRIFCSTASFLLVLFLLIVLFSSAWFDRTGARAAFNFRVDWRILPASVLLCLALLVLAALALGLSTRLSLGPTLICCALVLMLGLVSDHLFGTRATHSTLATLCYAIIPNWQHFWMADAINGTGHIPWSYVGQMALYAGGFVAVFLSLGALLFRRVDVG